MLRSVFVCLVYMMFLVFGISAPFVFSLGYVWVDTFYPQIVGGSLLGQVPVSLIMAIAAIAGFALFDRRKVKPTAATWLLLVFAVWVTLTTAFWAVAPDAAWNKWNAAFKTICFGAFIPLVFRSRLQIEALMQIYVFSIMIHFLPGGIKTLINGGGYGLTLGVIGSDTLLAEGSTLCSAVFMLIPIMLFLRKHTVLIPRSKLSDLGFAALIIIAMAAAVGTYERTAIVGMAVAGLGLWLRSRRKLLFGTAGVAGILLLSLLTSDQWAARISTIGHLNTEGSALGRFLVWQWTLGFAKDHPLGGGFNSFLMDEIVFPAENGAAPVVRHGVAFHNIFFEVLGEQGYVGLAMFLMIIAYAFVQLRTSARIAKDFESLQWARDLAHGLQVSLAVLLSCGSFVGIAFQPMIYTIVAVSACLRTHVRETVIPAPRQNRHLVGVGQQALD